MTVKLNHTIVASHDAEKSATFLTRILGLPPPTRLGHFVAVQIGDMSLDFFQTTGDVTQQHYAFLVSESEFDEIFERISDEGLSYWADPLRRERGRTNSWDDGRGVYFDDPSGHLLEIITRPYGSGGTTADSPHPLLAPTVKRADNDGSGGDEE
ncbi:MAG: VOC family protein [Woeseia sp.]|nr:VOC family protein [Woeseia sp.]